MSKHHSHTNKFSDKIRNVPAFVKSYFGGEHGKQQLNRPVRFNEVKQKDSKGREIIHREPKGYNTMAHAMYLAFCGS